MSSIPKRLSANLCACILFTILSSILVYSSTPALPESVAKARTIFVENNTGFAELGYSAVLELNKWGQFEVVAVREKADIVLRLTNGTSVHLVPEGQTPGARGASSVTDEGVPQGRTRISLIDPKSGESLWSDLHRTEGPKVKNGHLLDGLREAFENYEKARSRK